MYNKRHSTLPLREGDNVHIVGGRTGHIEAIDGDELQIALDGGGTVFKPVYAVDLITVAHESGNTKHNTTP